MSKYKAATGPEAECEAGSRGLVMRNKVGIRRKTEMDQVFGRWPGDETTEQIMAALSEIGS